MGRTDSMMELGIVLLATLSSFPTCIIRTLMISHFCITSNFLLYSLTSEKKVKDAYSIFLRMNLKFHSISDYLYINVYVFIFIYFTSH